ncbi:cation-transporting P-type ATPase [Candidatus Babeliales bacterium]|nr:cation-transporting P-type ATPase [Candidatus Babeliales bacterium]
MLYYQETIESVLDFFGTDVDSGLYSDQVKVYKKKYGSNVIKKAVGKSLFYVFISQFHDPLVYLLLGSAVIIFFAGSQFDAFIISGILLLNGIFGTFQEGRIALLADQLKEYTKGSSLVIRDGKKIVISDADLVPGDIILFQEGDKIPADARVIEVTDFCVNESMLTGETEVVKKETDALEGTVDVLDQKNMVFSGSFVEYGYGKAIITAIGKKTYWGALHSMIESIEPEMPFKEDLTHLLKVILVSITGLCFFLLVVGILTGRPFAELLAALTALFICVVPQGLPMIMTLAFVSGAYRMAKKNVLVKKLQVVEALGRMNTLILDKTGTVTCNQLMVSHIIAGENEYSVTGSGYEPEGDVLLHETKITFKDALEPLKIMTTATVLLNHAQVTFSEKQDLYQVKGNSTEAALLRAAQKLGMDEFEIRQQYTLLHEFPFSSFHQQHSGLYTHNNGTELFLIGSPESLEKDGFIPTETQKKLLETYFDKGLRVIGVVHARLEKPFPGMTEAGEKFVITLKIAGSLIGYYGMNDTPRAGAKETIQQLQDAGITLIMATGDNIKTARHIAQEVGIIDQQGIVVEGKDAKHLFKDIGKHACDTDGGILESFPRVYARVSPQDKFDLVLSCMLSKCGATTGMVGDGVNDVLALGIAHVGITLAASGTELAKRKARVILLKDAFNSLPAAVAQGRHIFMTLKRVTLYFFTTNFSEIMVLVGAFVFKMPLPLLAPHILWLNLVTDGFLDSALALEEEEPGMLNKNWLKTHKKLISTDLIMRVIYQSGVVAILSFGCFFMYAYKDLALARTLCMVTLTVCQWVMALNCRSLHHSVFSLKLTGNKWMLTVLCIIPVLLCSILYSSWGQRIFKVVPLGWNYWKFILTAGVVLLCIEEVRKWIVIYKENK